MDEALNIRRNLLVCLLLIVATVSVYWDVRNHDFVNYDDDKYIAENRHVRNGLTLESIAWAFGFADKGKTYWHPLTWFSHMLDCQLYGPRPGMHHLTGLIIHVANSLLLFLVLKRMTGGLWSSAFVAGLFALHPLNVESVAWVFGRKNVLSTFFWILTMLAYAYYSERPGIYRYLLTFFVFSLGLLAKPMLVTLPFAMLLLDYWPLGRLRFGQQESDSNGEASKSIPFRFKRSSVVHLVWEKVPFLALSLISTYVSSFSLQGVGGMVSTESVPMKLRISNALVSYVGYLEKMIWPQDLAIVYPYPDTVPMWKAALAGLFLLSISLVVLLTARRKPYLSVGWLWFLGTLVPVIGLVQAGIWPAMADRWAYVPLIGLFIIIAWGVPDFVARWRYKATGLAIIAATFLSILTAATWLQVRYWHNSITLFQHALDVTTNNWLAHNNLGVAMTQENRADEAIRHYSEALRINPDFVAPHFNLGGLLSQQDRIDEAIIHFREALRIEPDDAMAHISLGNALSKQGKTEEAITHHKEALRINPNDAMAHNSLGNALSKQGRPNEAIRHFNEALRIDPDYVEAHNNLGSVLSKHGKMDEAIRHFNEALRINPDYATAHYNLGEALSKTHGTDEAIRHYNEALRLDPDYADAHYNLANVLSEQGRMDAAIRHYYQVLRMDPDYEKAHSNLGIALIQQNRADEAMRHFREALRIKPNCAEVNNNLGAALAIQGKVDEAIGYFREALRIDPGFVRAQINLKRLHQ